VKAVELKDIEQLDREALAQLWSEMLSAPLPRQLSQTVMRRVLASEFQWRSSGQRRDAVIRRLRRVLATADRSMPTSQAGQRLVREWNGKRHIVDVTRDGFVWNGRTWRSLSAIAREITGARWSGPRFFGIRG
jgi:predicted component of type VI protein secretion system